jgi:hypothetical protein
VLCPLHGRRFLAVVTRFLYRALHFYVADFEQGWPHRSASTREPCGSVIFRERVERLLDYLDEMFTLHPSPTEINKGTLTPSSRRRLRRHHRHLLCRRLCLPLPLRLGLLEQLPSNQTGLGRGILDAFCSLPNGTPRTPWQAQRAIIS